jgi:hypothetical protein
MSEMAVNLAYNLAQIDPDTNMCIAVITTSNPAQAEEPNWVEIPVYDPEYILKYYIHGSWYVDAAGTIPWTSPLL